MDLLHTNYIDYYYNGQLCSNITVKYDMVFDGEYRGWYENGIMRQHSWYKNGELDGHHQTWYDNGQKCLDCRFKDGKHIGKFIMYYRNGKIKKEKYF